MWIMRTVMVLALTVASGCASAKSPASVAPIEASGISAGFSRSWDAVIGILAERNIQVKTLDKSSGFVSAEATGVRTKDANAVADCGGLIKQMDATGPVVASYNILVKGDSSTSTVKVTARFSKTGERPYNCESTNFFEQSFQSAVKSRAEARPR